MTEPRASEAAPSASDRAFFGHPLGLATLFFTELWERFSYYGMRGILVLYMTDTVRNGMGMGAQQASAIYGLYTFGVYALALPGGWMADKMLGQRLAVLYGGIIIALGHFTMAVPNDMAFYLGMFLIVLGTGLLKPNVSSVVGDLYPEGGARRDAGFSIFYMGINIGALAGPLVCGYLGENVDWHLGFGAAGVGMTLGLISYVFGMKKMVGAGELKGDAAHPDSVKRATRQFFTGVAVVVALTVAIVALSNLGVLPLTLVGFAQSTGVIVLLLAIAYFLYIGLVACKDSVERARIGVIFLLFLGAAMFWSGFEQAGSSMNLFAENHTDRIVADWGVFDLLGGAEDTSWWYLLGFGVVLIGVLLYRIVRFADLAPARVKLLNRILAAGVLVCVIWATQVLDPGSEAPTSWLQSINPFFIIVLAPVMGMLWIKLGAYNPSIPMKFGIGLLLLGVGFFVLAWGSQYIEAGKVSPMWLVTTYFFHTVGELCLSPIGLSSITKLAPQRLVSQMMGTWFVGAALGNLIAGLIAGYIEDLPPDQLFTTVALIVIGSGVLFMLFSRPIAKLTHGVK